MAGIVCKEGFQPRGLGGKVITGSAVCKLVPPCFVFKPAGCSRQHLDLAGKSSCGLRTVSCRRAASPSRLACQNLLSPRDCYLRTTSPLGPCLGRLHN
jgi:hypothetical protein